MKFSYTNKEYIASILTISGSYSGQAQETSTMVVNISTPSFALYGPGKSISTISPLCQ